MLHINHKNELKINILYIFIIITIIYLILSMELLSRIDKVTHACNYKFKYLSPLLKTKKYSVLFMALKEFTSIKMNYFLLVIKRDNFLLGILRRKFHYIALNCGITFWNRLLSNFIVFAIKLF